jgi:hypothetical protein
MAVIKVTRNLNVEHIYIQVTCPECDKTVRMKMRSANTRKTCPKCNRVTYNFIIAPMRGYIGVGVLTIGPDQTPTEYDLSPSDVEIELDEDNNGDEPDEFNRDEEPEF